MKLRNKKTGEIGKLDAYDENKEMFAIKSNGKTIYYFSLADLCDDWEDYKPAESLIKDEKIRKAVRFKAEALAGAIEQSVKEFIDDITELCGEEEE